LFPDRSLFLLDQLRKDGKLPEAGRLSTPLKHDDGAAQAPTLISRVNNPHKDPTVRLNDKSKIPQLAFGMYLVPNDASGEQTVIDAINAGYRHFDCASFYGNESILGQAMRQSCIPRDEFCVATKVWKDALRDGRSSVRKSVIDSISKLDCGGYIDICYIHWPVPEHFVDAYHELQLLYSEGKIRSIGLSNFTPDEYETLSQSGISVLPVVVQMEVSVVMYRPDQIKYFQSLDIKVVAFKPLNRGGAFESTLIQDVASRHGVSPAQIMLRWCIQKGLIVISKTTNAQRMVENRSLFSFSLDKEDMIALDSLTSADDRRHMEQKELDFKHSL
jgi:diketogulonate reductase-like aldo/keto reductase